MVYSMILQEKKSGGNGDKDKGGKQEEVENAPKVDRPGELTRSAPGNGHGPARTPPPDHPIKIEE